MNDKIILISAIIGVTIFVAFISIFIFVEQEQPFVVKGCSWERLINIEKNTLITEEGWYVPFGGEVIDSWTELRGWKHVQVGTDRNGNAEYVDIPDYDTKYRYRIWRYIWERSVNASGLKEAGETPVWPNVVFRDREREGSRHETYTIHLESEKKLTNFKTDFNQWQKVEKGFIVLGHKNIFGGLRRIDLLEET